MAHIDVIQTLVPAFGLRCLVEADQMLPLEETVPYLAWEAT